MKLETHLHPDPSDDAISQVPDDIQDKDDQRHGIEAALAKYGPITTHEMLMKCP